MYALSFGCVTIIETALLLSSGHVERKKYSIYLIIPNEF